MMFPSYRFSFQPVPSVVPYFQVNKIFFLLLVFLHMGVHREEYEHYNENIKKFWLYDLPPQSINTWALTYTWKFTNTVVWVLAVTGLSNLIQN